MIILRNVRPDMTSHGGFVWPKSGPVEAPDWDPTPTCGHGLHGLRSGDNHPGEWYSGPVLGVEVEAIVNLDGKCKFPRGTVVFCGTMAEFCVRYPGVWYAGTATAGYAGTATAGNAGTATAGDRGTATAGYAGTATAGNRGTATAGDRGTATAGNRGIIQIRCWDGTRARARVVTGYVGEGGIMANVPYRLVGGKLAIAKEGKTP